MVLSSEFAGKACGFYYPGFESHYNFYHLPLFKPLFTHNIPKLWVSSLCNASTYDSDLLQIRQINAEFDESLHNPLNECHRHLNIKSDLNNDDIPVSMEMTNMIHENYKFVYTFIH